MVVLFGVVLLVATAFSAVSAASTTESWTAKLGTGGRYGSVTITRTVTNFYSRYRASASIKNYRPNATYSVTDRRGNCTVLGAQITTPLMSMKTGAKGTATRTIDLNATKGNAIIQAMQAGSVAIRVGTPCGYLKGPAAVVIPTPTPTPPTNFSPGPGVPVLAPGHGQMVVTAAESWSDPSVPVDPGTTLDTVSVQCSSGACVPDDFALRDADGVDHPNVTPGRPGFEWLTFVVPTALATDVTLVWMVGGVEYLVPLHLPVPPEPVMALSLAATTGLDGAHIANAVGTPTGYVAVGWTGSIGATWVPAAWTSADGLAWTQRTVPAVAGGGVGAVARGSSGLLVAVGEAPITTSGYHRAAIWTSSDDGVTWTRVTGLSTNTIPGGAWRAVTAFGTGFAVVGNLPVGYGTDGYNGHAGAMTSSDGVHWTRSSLIAGATSTFMSGVIAGGPGLIAWGGTDAYADVVSGTAEVWTSTTGDTWSISPPARDWHNPDGGGATYRQMELIFGSTGAWTGLVTYGDSEMRPLVYTSTVGSTWTPVDVAASLRLFRPAAVTPIGDEWLVGGFSDTNAGYGPTAWFGHGGTWAPVTVPSPAGATAFEFARIEGFANGPEGVIAVGTIEFQSPNTRQGVVWTVPTP